MKLVCVCHAEIINVCFISHGNKAAGFVIKMNKELYIRNETEIYIHSHNAKVNLNQRYWYLILLKLNGHERDKWKESACQFNIYIYIVSLLRTLRLIVKGVRNRCRWLLWVGNAILYLIRESLLMLLGNKQQKQQQTINPLLHVFAYVLLSFSPDRSHQSHYLLHSFFFFLFFYRDCVYLFHRVRYLSHGLMPDHWWNQRLCDCFVAANVWRTTQKPLLSLFITFSHWYIFVRIFLVFSIKFII